MSTETYNQHRGNVRNFCTGLDEVQIAELIENETADENRKEYAREFLHEMIENRLPMDFKKDADGRIWFVSGGSECVGDALCHWHASGGDPVYAAGSSTIANVGVPVDIVSGALASLERNMVSFNKEDQDGLNFEWSEADIYELTLLIRLLSAAVKADPSEEIQDANDI